jgi:hypothetical protein
VRRRDGKILATVALMEEEDVEACLRFEGCTGAGAGESGDHTAVVLRSLRQKELQIPGHILHWGEVYRPHLTARARGLVGIGMKLAPYRRTYFNAAVWVCEFLPLVCNFWFGPQY